MTSLELLGYLLAENIFISVIIILFFLVFRWILVPRFGFFLAGFRWLLFWVYSVTMVIGLTFGVALSGEFFIFFPQLFVLACLFGDWFVQRVFVPLGWVKASFYWSFFSSARWERDLYGGALLSAVLALDKQKQRSPEDIVWLQGKLAHLKKLKGSRLVAYALMDELQGNTSFTDLRMSMAKYFVMDSMPRKAAEYALLWPIANAAKQGKWEDIERICTNWKVVMSLQDPLGATLPSANPPNEVDGQTPPLSFASTRFLLAVALHISSDKERLSRGQLLRLWLLAPNRVLNYPLFLKVWKNEPVGFSGTGQGDGDLWGELPKDALPKAIWAHAILVQIPSKRRKHRYIRKVASYWEDCFATGTLEISLQERAESLGARRWSESFSQFQDGVTSELAGWLRHSDLSYEAEEESSLLREVYRMLQNENLDRVEGLAQAMQERATETKKTLPLMEDWREWELVLDSYDRCVRWGGLDFRRLTFETINYPVCCMAVWLWNEEDKKLLSNAMFRWLLHEAIIVGLEATIKLQLENVVL